MRCNFVAAVSFFFVCRRRELALPLLPAPPRALPAVRCMVHMLTRPAGARFFSVFCFGMKTEKKRELPGLVKDGCRYSFNMVRTGCKSGHKEQYDAL